MPCLGDLILLRFGQRLALIFLRSERRDDQEREDDGSESAHGGKAPQDKSG